VKKHRRVDGAVAVRVDAEHAVGSERCEEQQRRDDEQDEREPETPDRLDDAAAVGDELRSEHGERNRDVLDACGDGEA
jgi:hypothetical protein